MSPLDYLLCIYQKEKLSASPISFTEEKSILSVSDFLPKYLPKWSYNLQPIQNPLLNL